MGRTSKLIWSTLAALIVLVGVAALTGAARFRAGDKCSYPSTPGTTPGLPAVKARSDPYPASQERPLLMEPLPEARDLYLKVTTEPLDGEHRALLAAVYERRGYRAAAQFFSLTKRLLEEHTVGPFPRLPETFKCLELRGVNGQAPSDLAVAREIGKAVGQMNVLTAVEKARGYLQEEGWSCPVGVQWADSLMMLPLLTHEDWATREMQVRIYITAVEEGGAKPEVFTSFTDAEAWQRLSVYFERMNDMPSAYVAEVLHQRALAGEPGCGPGGCDGRFGEEISRRLHRMEDCLHLR